MNKEELDELAKKASRGCADSMWKIKAHFQPVIHKLSEKHWHRMRSEERFESNCFKRIEKAVMKFDPSKGSLAWQVSFRIRQLVFQHISRFKHVETVEFSPDLYENNGDLAVVEIIIANEKIASLAGGDPRKLAILKAWIDECNDSDTATLLAQRFGGLSESHRKYISRFKSHCQKALAGAI